MPVVCVCALSVRACLLCFVSDYQVTIFRRAEKINADANQVGDVRNRRAGVLSPIAILKLARTSNVRFGRSADTLE